MNLVDLANLYPQFFMPFAFALGAVWGSFLNVCIYRLPLGKSIVYPGSHCYACGAPIRWYDNIPLFSYVLLGGNCRDCGTHFSPRYFFVELLTALLFLGLYVRFGIAGITLTHWILAAFLIVATFTDLDHYVIPEGVSRYGLWFAIGIGFLMGGASIVAADFRLCLDLWQNLFAYREESTWTWVQDWYAPGLWSLVGAGFGWTLLTGIAIFGRILFRKEAMGGGDIKLFTFLGAYFGPVNCLFILFLSASLGSIGGALLLLAHRLWGQDRYDELTLDSANARRPPNLGAIHDNVELTKQSVQGAFLPRPQADESQPCDMQLLPARTRVVRVARRTSRQLHHFPFGPYIALAALIVLFSYETINAALREYLMLSPDTNRSEMVVSQQ